MCWFSVVDEPASLLLWVLFASAGRVCMRVSARMCSPARMRVLTELLRAFSLIGHLL